VGESALPEQNETMIDIGKMLILVGVLLTIVGSVLILVSKLSWFGQLPGDIVLQRDKITCFFPLATSLLLSIVLTILLNLVLYIIRR
jgi:hypothetical protein